MLTTIPYKPKKPLTFLRIINCRIATIARKVGLIKHELDRLRNEKKLLLIDSVKIQKANFESKVKKIPQGHSSKSRHKNYFNKGHSVKSKNLLTPEDMIAAMTPADRQAMVALLTKQQQGV